jgi:hypothetical protein
MLAIVLAGIALTKSLSQRGEQVPANDPDAASTATATATDRAAAPVTLSIDFGDGRPQIAGHVIWRKGMTVRDAMQGAPNVRFQQQGSGASAFLMTLENQSNEGAGGRNWMYSVNGQRADRSFAVYELAAGDHVLWTFTPPQ